MSDLQKKSLIRIAAGIVLFAVLLFLQYGGILYRIETLWIRVLITTVLAIAAYVTGGLQVILRAAEALTKGRLMHPHVLAVLATFGAFALGHYTDAVAVILLFAVSELIASFAEDRCQDLHKGLDALLPEKVKVQRNGAITEIPPTKIEAGETVILEAGERIPADGKVTEGASVIDISPLTGSDGRKKVKIGDTVLSGCVNEQELLIIRAEKSGRDSFLERQAGACSVSAGSPGKLMRSVRRWPIDRALVFAGLAVVFTVVFALIRHESLETALPKGLAMLIAAAGFTPLVSVPLTVSEGLSALIRNSIFPKNTETPEKAASIRTLVLRKQGTLTQGDLRVEACLPADEAGISAEELLAKAAAMTLFSREPYAKAIRAACSKGMPSVKVTDTEEVKGMGVRGRMNGEPFLIGSRAFLEEADVSGLLQETDGFLLHAASGGKYLGALVISEDLKEDVKAELEKVREAGVSSLYLASEEGEGSARKAAEMLGFDDVLSGSKQAIEDAMAHLRAKENTAACAGLIRSEADLKHADVNIAVRALETPEAPALSDLTIMDGDLSKIGTAVRISKQTVRTAKCILIVSVIVSILVLVLSGAGILTMGPAALLMTLWFGISVYLSLRIRKAAVKEDANG